MRRNFGEFIDQPAFVCSRRRAAVRKGIRPNQLAQCEHPSNRRPVLPAMSIGSEVLTPWPISGFFDVMVTRPSG